MIKIETIYKEKEDKYIYELKEQFNVDNKNNSKTLNYEIKDQIDKVKKLINFKGLINDIDIIRIILKSNKLNITVNSVEEVIKFINTKDLFSLIGLSCKDKNMNFKYPFLYEYIQLRCKTIEEVKATLKINNDDNNILINQVAANIFEVYSIYETTYRLFYNKQSKSYYISVSRKDDETNSINFNFIEFYSMLANLTKGEAIKQIIELLDITVLEIQSKIDVYNKNIQIMKNDIINYTYLYKLIKKHINLMIVMLNLACERCYQVKSTNSIGDIIITVKELAENINKSSSTITPYLNAFCVLGFIEKKPLNRYHQKNNRNDIISYTIFEITEEKLNNAEIIAKKIVDKNITLSKINNKTITMLFGEDVTKKVITDKNTLNKGAN